MVFKSKNLFRKCKYCEKERAINMKSGRHKGYYTTCGSKECLTNQYKDSRVCKAKGRCRNIKFGVCQICHENFDMKSPKNTRYCKECVPDKSWRGRAHRYLIGKKQWDVILKNQENKCALCEAIPEAVDHCHKKGIVRGILCQRCNINIKILEGCPEYLKKAMKYVGIDYVQI